MKCDAKKKEDKQWMDTIYFIKSSELEESDVLYKLPDCGHVFLLEALDNYMYTAQANNGHKSIGLKCCPQCKTPIILGRQ